MAEVEIYGPPQSTYVRTARMAFEEKGVPYSLQPIEFGSDQHKALHPFGRVPAMKHGDVHLYETLAIATYADLAFDGLKLQPAAPRGRALMMQWTSVVIDYVYQYAVHDVVIERLAAPSRGREPDEEKIKNAIPHVKHCMSVIDRALGGTPYLAGADLSLADLYVAPIVSYLKMLPEGQEALAGLSAIDDWFDKVSARPSFPATMPPAPQQEAAE